jgi:hypothetical protein
VREALTDRSRARHFSWNGRPIGAEIRFGGQQQFVVIVSIVDHAWL